MLENDAFRQDPRIDEAKKLLLNTLKDHQKNLTSIEPPNPEKAIQYKDLIASFNEARGVNLYYPYLGSGFGSGSLVELIDGSVKYDMITGIGVHYMGHSNPQFVSSAIDAALSNTIMQGNLQQNKDSLELAETLLKLSGLPHCFFTTSGAMANENALKVALQKNSPASRILAFDHCFAGRTLAFSQITDKPSFREGLPHDLAVDYVPFFDPKHPQQSIESACHTLKKHIARYPKLHALMIFELVQGEAGFYPGTTEFFESLMKICHEHNIAVFADEIQTFGRLEKLFAFQHFGLEKYVDIVTIGKLSQVCATLFKQHYRPKPGLLSQTFTGATECIYACKTMLQELTNGTYYGPHGRIAQIHKRFVKHLTALEMEHPNLIQGPFGIGAMIAFTPYGGGYESTTKFVHALFNRGVISFIAGTNPTRVRFLPPVLVIKDEEIDRVMEIVKKTLLETNV